MDENYLDSLLNEVSLDKEIDDKIEQELDNQIQKEKRQYQEQQVLSDEDLFNLDLEQDVSDIHTEQDLHFSEEQMDELDHLDNLADLDMGDLDFSDIDFDDLDVTKLDDVGTDELDDLLKEFEGDFDVGNLFDTKQDTGSESFSAEEDGHHAIDETESHSVIDDSDASIPSEDLNEDSFDADSFLDSLLDDEQPPKPDELEKASEVTADSEAFGETENGLNEMDSASATDSEDDDLDLMKALEEFEGFGEFDSAPVSNDEKTDDQLTSEEGDDLEELLSMLDLDDLSGETASSASQESEPANDGQIREDDLLELDDIEKLSPDKKDKKQKLMEVLFGEPDEDDIISDEELAEIEAKKAAKKKKKADSKKAKAEKAKAAKEEKAVKSTQKKKADQEKKTLKAQKKARLRAQALAEEEPEKKLNKPVVIFIFTIFLGGLFVFYLAANNFNYAQAIERATNYFANQKYRKAYDEIVGVEVKEEDENLKDRIYTVMYVERLYEAYLNNVELGRYEKALDSLLRGVDKYYEHYEEAKELGITSDLDYSFSQIQAVLSDKYGITVEQAIELNKLDNYDYVQYIQGVVGQMPEEELEEVPQQNEPSEETTATDVESEDAMMPEEQKEEVEE